MNGAPAPGVDEVQDWQWFLLRQPLLLSWMQNPLVTPLLQMHDRGQLQVERIRI